MDGLAGDTFLALVADVDNFRDEIMMPIQLQDILPPQVSEVFYLCPKPYFLLADF